MLPVVTSTVVEEESGRKDEERATFCGHQMQKYPLFGGCLAFASPLHLLSLSFVFLYFHFIHHLSFLNGQIYIPEV